MGTINRLADRLLQKLAPTVTADAACVYLYTDKYLAGDPNCPSGIKNVIVTYYDNCPPRTRTSCFG